MVQATFHFPRGFLWGSATSSHQVEGNNQNNNWWAWEGQPGRILHEQKSGLACDWWNGRWRDDLDRAQEGKQNAHRLSIEWSRVQPAPDRWDESAIDRYREIVRGLHERNMHALVTLHHFTNPLWVEEKGGWENPEIADWFGKYVYKIVEALVEYCTNWVTINEPNVLVAMAYASDKFPPGKNNISTATRVMTNLARGHASAYRAIHAIQPQARAGLALNIRPAIPRTSWSPLDRLVTGVRNRTFNDFFPQALATGVLRFPISRIRIPEIKGTQDFLGVNYYTRDLVNFSLLHPGELFSRRSFPKNADLSDSGQIASDPQGMFQVLKWANGFKLPILITENGVDNANDQLRPRYLIEHLHQVWRAVNFNWPIKGYFHWTLVDNFEWERGWTQRFGLWELEPETQTRRKRPSADLYAEICRENGISTEMVARYAPEIGEKLFPGPGF